MHATDLALNKALGMQLASAGSSHVLEMPETVLLLNHVGTVHASAQFALAEAGSGEFLLSHLGDAQSQVFAVLRLEREVSQTGARSVARFRAVCRWRGRDAFGRTGRPRAGFGFCARRGYRCAGSDYDDGTV